MVDKKIIGTLILIFLVGAVYISMLGVRIRIDVDKATFYVKENNVWVVSGREYLKIFEGSSQLNRNVSGIVINTVTDDVNQNVTITKITPYIRGPLIRDTYKFDGKIDDVSLFPIAHTIEVINASGKYFRYEIKNLVYSGPTYKLNGETELVFGRNMKLQLQPGYRWAWVYSSGVVKAQYEISTDYEIFNIRFYDPVITLYLNGSSVNRFYEYNEPVNITGTADTGSVCLSIDAYGYGDNYTCGSPSITVNLKAFANQIYINGSSTKAINISSNSTFNMTFHNRSIILKGAKFNFTGFLATNYPEDVKMDIGNNGIIDVDLRGQMINKTLYNTKFNDSATSKKKIFVNASSDRYYIRTWRDFNATSLLLDVEGTGGNNITFYNNVVSYYSAYSTSNPYYWWCYAPTGGYKTSGGYVYSIGGKCYRVGTTGWYYNKTFRYTVSANDWDLTTYDSPYEIGPNSCTVTNKTNGYLYVTGGGGNNQPSTATANFYNFSGTTWNAMPVMPAARYGAGCFLANNKIFVVGGLNTAGVEQSTTYIFNFSDSTWYTGAAATTPHAFAQMVILNSTHALKVAGYDTTWDPKTLYYNYIADSWTDPLENFYRYGHAAYNIDGVVYTTGGAINPTGYTNETYYWNDTDTEWYLHPDQMPDTTYMSSAETINFNGTMFLFSTSEYGYGPELMVLYFKPKNPILQIGYPATPSWNFAGFYDQKRTTSNMATDMNNFLAEECSTDICDVPVTISSASAGALNISNIKLNSTLGEVELDASTVQGFVNTNNNVIFGVNASAWGTLQINSANFPYNGSQNITVKAHTPDYTTNDTQYLYTVFSNFTAAFPLSFMIEPIFLPDTNNSRNVSMWGQTATIPGYNITGKGYDRDFNLSIRVNQSLDACMNMTAGSSNIVYNISKVNTTSQQLFSGISWNESVGVWLKMNLYNCNSSTAYRNWWLELRSCCDQCMRCW